MNFSEAMAHRFACRQYQDRPISPDDLKRILDYGRLTPSSFGLEGWSFHVVEGGKREELFQACFSQDAVRLAPLSIVLVARTALFYDPDGPSVFQRASRFGEVKPFVDDYRGYYQYLKDSNELDQWSRRQCYLVAGNMMTGAKTLGIDSIALEGFDGPAVLKVLDLSPKDWQVALVIPFGYADEPERKKIREPLEDLVVYHR
jgi:nitroreductase